MKRLFRITAMLATAVAASLMATAQHQTSGRVLPSGDRALGIDITTPVDGDFVAALMTAADVGATVNGLHLNWTDIETSPGVYDPAIDYLAIANAFYPPRGTSIALTIAPIDTNRVHVPADLAGLPFDDPLVIHRFNLMLDWALPRVPDLDIVSLSIGNEVDGVLGSDAALYAQYKTFFDSTADHARALRPGLAVGVKGIHAGMVGTARALFRSLNQTSDVILTTYYPLNDDFTVKHPSTVAPDMADLVAIYPARPIFLLETGYPSGTKADGANALPATNSTTQLQSLFVREMFRAWDRHAASIKIVKFTWMHEIPGADVTAYLDYYGLNDPGFREYLATLGLRHRSEGGRDKPAFRVLRRQATARGF